MGYWQLSTNTLRFVGLAFALAFAATACIDGDSVPLPPVVGQSGGFVTAEPSDEYQGGPIAMPSADAGASADAGTTAPSGDGGSEPPGGRDAKVEEAEIYRVHGDKLFYLNTYRGLLIFDIKDESKPKLLSRLPVYGYPIEMYFKDDSAFVLIKDALYLTQTAGKPVRFLRHNVSQLITVDFKDASAPKVLQRHDIEGLLREGLSRKVDDTIYVVSERPSYYYNGWGGGGSKLGDESVWVYSYEVRDPKLVKAVDKLKLFDGGGSSQSGNGSYASRSLRGVAISATANALMVTERWRHSTYNSGSCGDWFVESTVRIIDISDPSGQIHEHTAFTRRGDLTDQFKQTYVYDPVKKTGLYLGIFARNEWTDCKRVVQNELVAIDITDASKPKELSSVAFGKPNETVRGSVFDVQRKVAFAITARAIDPLYALSFADPKALKIESEIDGLSGDMSVFRFIGGGKFLLAVGRDNSNSCTGFDTGWSSTKMAVSIIDVQHLDAIRLVQRRCVAVDGARWQRSSVSNNQDQAHKMLGMYSDELINLIAVPVTYYEEVGGSADPWSWWYMRRSAVGMMSWDLSRYDPLLPPAQQQVLTDLATVLHPQDEVKRTIFLRRDGPQGAIKRLMLTLSDTHMAINDISVLTAPKERASVEIAPYIAGVYKLDSGHVVEHVRHGGANHWYYNDRRPSTFRVKLPAADGALDKQVAQASIVIGGVQTVLQQDNKLLLLRRSSQWSGSGYRSDLLVLDFAKPDKPTLAGRVELPGRIYGYAGGCGAFDHYYYYWGSYQTRSFAQTDEGLVLLTHASEWDHSTDTRRTWTTLTAIDLRNAGAPTIVYNKNIHGWDSVGDVLRDAADAKRVLITARQSAGTATRDGLKWNLYRYYTLPARLEAGKLRWETPINTPGRVFSSYGEKVAPKLLTSSWDYTLREADDRRYCSRPSCHYTKSPRLHLLHRQGATATLRASHQLTRWQVRTSLMDGEKLALLTRRSYDYRDASGKRDYYPKLHLFDLSQDRFDGGSALEFETSSVSLLAAYTNRLMLGLSGDGVLTLDIADVRNVRGMRFTRTLGWLHNIAFDKTRAWVASGHFGTQLVPLDKQVMGVAKP